MRPYAIVLAGLVAGAAAAVLSHPADLMLTRLCGAATANVATSAAECVIAEGFVEQARAAPLSKPLAASHWAELVAALPGADTCQPMPTTTFDLPLPPARFLDALQSFNLRP